MSKLAYFNYPGFGERARKNTNYSQAVRIGNKIEISGQGGWDPETGKIVATDIAAEVNQAFANVELALKTAGGKGWDEVYKVRCYVTAPMDDKSPHLVRNLKKYCPNHAPILTGIGVNELAVDGMNIEIEVKARLEE